MLANNVFGRARPSTWAARLEAILATRPVTSSYDRKNQHPLVPELSKRLHFAQIEMQVGAASSL